MPNENQEQKLSYRERLKAKFPDMAAQTDEDYALMSEMYFDDTEAEMTRYRDSEKAVSDLIESDPELKAVLSDMLINGMPFKVAIAKHIAPEDLNYDESEDNYDSWQKAKQERLDKAAKWAEMQKEIANNEIETSKVFNQFCDEKNIPEAERDAFLQIINDNLIGLLYKKVDKKFLELCYKGSTYDKAVEEATQEGIIAGRNQKIQAIKAKDDQERLGDGLPSPSGRRATQEREKPKTDPFFAGMRNREEF